MARAVHIRETGQRDGLQNLADRVSTSAKCASVEASMDAGGLRRAAS